MKNKAFAKAGVSFLIITVFFAYTFCCSFSSLAQAERGCQACHQHTASTKDHCCKTQYQADLPSSFSYNKAIQSATVFASLESLVDPISFPRAKFDLAYLDGPPGPISNTPFYIQFRNLRI